MSYAIFKTGGKQFRAEAGTTLRIPSIEGEPGATVVFDDVLSTEVHHRFYRATMATTL